MIDPEIKRLIEFDERVQEIAHEFGLDFFSQEFDIIPAQKMLEILAYNFPVNYSHWSYGRDYEIEKTKYEHGYGIPLEVVLNSNPSRAYLMNTNSFAVQVMVMSHVYAHNDFMKNSSHFRPTRKDILPSASEATSRFQLYEKKYGLNPVEGIISAGLSIEMNTDPDFFIKEESEEEQRERLSTPSTTISRGKFDDLINKRKSVLDPNIDYKKEYLYKRTPVEPERDVLLYIINHSPKPLLEWEKDVLSVIRDQSRYFMPQRRTKIMNEGWAALWHMRIMERLFNEGWLNEQDHGYYNYCNSRVLAENPRSINPYLIGSKMFEDIENRWNKGQFGKEWDECLDPKKKEEWDLKLGLGRQKIFEVRQSYSDRFFIEHFLTEKLVNDLKLYLYEADEKPGEIEYIISDKHWKVIKNLLVSFLSSFGVPLIMVLDGDFKGKRELYLKHFYDEIELDEEYRKKTMEYIYYLWDRPVYLETVVDDVTKIYTYNGIRHEGD